MIKEMLPDPAGLLLDGRALAERHRQALLPRVRAVRDRRGTAPGLGVVWVGEDPASQIYVRNKARAAAQVGLFSRVVRLPADATQDQVADQVAALNEDPAIDAFLLQLPLPGQLTPALLVAKILPHKDADGLHPHNVAALAAGHPGPRPCTPLGCMALLKEAQVSLAGCEAVVVGRSAIVGRPMAALLTAADATVTLCHAKTTHLARHVARADVLIAAAGQPELICGHWIKPGAVVIDVGINRRTLADGSSKLLGDVEFAAARARARAITPVPGGVGPMTIALLLTNAVTAAEKACGLSHG